MERIFKLESAVQRLTEHERDDKPRYERWHQETTARLAALEGLRPETTNGRLRDLEARPILVQLTEKEIKVFFNEWAEVFAGRAFFKLFLSVSGALGLILAILGAAIIAYFKLN